MKQVVELQDDETFVHSYDLNTVHKVVRQQCLGGGETGVLDAVITKEIGTRDDSGHFTPSPGIRHEERCNPYASVIPVSVRADA